MKRSVHFNVVAGNWLNVYSLSVDKLVCEHSDLSSGSSHIFVNDCDHELYVVNKGDEWRSYWVEDSHVIGSNCCTIRSVSDFLREKSCFFCGDIVDAFTDVSGIFTVVFGYLDGDGKIAHCHSDKWMYRVREEVAFDHWLSRGFMYNSVSYELTDNSYVFYCSDEPVPFLANRKIGTYGFAENKFPFIVPFRKFNPDNIGKSLRYDVIKQQ